MGNGRRGRGEGSIYRRKDGRWVGQYDLCTDIGKKTKYIYGKTRKEVAAKLAKAMADRHQLGRVVDLIQILVDYVRFVQGGPVDT
jgi:hypothetical protein